MLFLVIDLLPIIDIYCCTMRNYPYVYRWASSRLLLPMRNVVYIITVTRPCVITRTIHLQSFMTDE